MDSGPGPCHAAAVSAPLSLTGKRWHLARKNAANIVETLRQERGLKDDPGAKLSDPMLFAEMGKAIARIRHAIEKGETVAVFGDYDADGITGSAQLVRFFRRHGIEPLVHLPDRMKEGYGMKKTSIDILKQKGASLIITVDTGISAHAEILHALSLGIDVIVTDHHRPQGGRPAAYAVIHPEIPSEFPNRNLSGSGVAFMLVRALEDGKPWQGIETDAALAAIGTVGDLVPLTGENRLLVIHGLRFLDKLQPSPLKDFIDDVRGSGPLTAGDIAFRVVPRINAAGRMAHPDIALRALLQGGDALQELHRLNGDRRTFVEELDELLGSDAALHDAFVLVASSDVTPGTAGLLASRFTERLGRPSLVAAVTGELAVASIRSPEGIDAMEVLGDPAVKQFLLTFGGHAQAAGCTFKAADVPALRSAFNEALNTRGITAESLVPSIHLDAALLPVALGPAFVRQLMTLSPFGAGNDEPLFLLPSQKIGDARTVGSDRTHLQCRIGAVKAIGFGLGALIDQVSSSQTFDIACRLGMDTWNGRESVQLFIEDIRHSV